MSHYQLTRTQKLPAKMEDVWEFISSPANLQEITPDHMGFSITSNTGVEKMYPGMIITYKVSPLWGIQMDWMTEITHVKELEYFVDEQRIGPYALWHHQHKIEQIDGGVLMSDVITYKPPYGVLGDLANKIIIKKQLNQIFDFRTIALEKKFGKYI